MVKAIFKLNTYLLQKKSSTELKWSNLGKLWSLLTIKVNIPAIFTLAGNLVWSKFFPVMVTVVPPRTLPTDGWTDIISANDWNRYSCLVRLRYSECGLQALDNVIKQKYSLTLLTFIHLNYVHYHIFIWISLIQTFFSRIFLCEKGVHIIYTTFDFCGFEAKDHLFIYIFIYFKSLHYNDSGNLLSIYFQNTNYKNIALMRYPGLTFQMLHSRCNWHFDYLQWKIQIKFRWLMKFKMK